MPQTVEKQNATGTDTTLGVRDSYCSLGATGSWTQLGRCLETPEQKLGYLAGLAAIVCWSSAHIILYSFHRQRTDRGKTSCIRAYFALFWFSESLGCLGATLAQQLPFQILFSIVTLSVHTLCGIHFLISQRSKKMVKRTEGRPRKCCPRLLRCFLPFIAALFPLVTLLNISSTVRENKRETRQIKPSDEDSMVLFRIAGYVMGSTAGLLYVCAHLIDVIDSYLTVDTSRRVIVAYVSSICAEVLYVTGVFTQDHSTPFYIHTLPWILPRLATAGIVIGILTQRVRQSRRGNRRKLSVEDADRLLSSASGSDTDWSSSETEELIWLPLKCVQSAIPQHPVCEARIQLLSETDSFSCHPSEEMDVSVSRRNSKVDEDVPTVINNQTICEDDSENEADSCDEPVVRDGDDDEAQPLIDRDSSTVKRMLSQNRIATWVCTDDDESQGRSEPAMTDTGPDGVTCPDILSE